MNVTISFSDRSLAHRRTRCQGVAGQRWASSGSWRPCRCPRPPAPRLDARSCGRCPDARHLHLVCPTSSPARELPANPLPPYKSSFPVLSLRLLCSLSLPRSPTSSPTLTLDLVDLLPMSHLVRAWPAAPTTRAVFII